MSTPSVAVELAGDMACFGVRVSPDIDVRLKSLAAAGRTVSRADKGESGVLISSTLLRRIVSMGLRLSYLF